MGNLVKEINDHVVHSDIDGPVEPVSLGKKKYILTFTVKRSRFAKVYIIESRSQARVCFEEFKSWLEHVTSVTVKHLHTDQAPEYMSQGE